MPILPRIHAGPFDLMTPYRYERGGAITQSVVGNTTS
jgi:hypothetical protein